jgi:abequosyltransferase
MVKLSICIPTYNRADFIVETLQSIVPQLAPGVELLILDGASPDNTQDVVRAYVGDHPQVRYHRECAKEGPDADFDKTVEKARGEYCWLFPDDDLMVPGAVTRVLSVLDERPELVVVDGEVQDVTLTMTLRPRRMTFSGLRRYGPGDADSLMADTAGVLSFLGAAIIRRDLWLSRDRKSYYGCYFLHVGVIFQKPPASAVAIGEPLIRIRYGNSLWTPKRFEIWGFSWPDLIQGFRGYSVAAKAKAGGEYPWRSFKHLISFRARSAFSFREYRQFFASRRVGPWRLMLIFAALIPGRLAHAMGTAFFLLRGQIHGDSAYELVRSSPYNNVLSRLLASGARWRSLPTTARPGAAMHCSFNGDFDGRNG